MIKVASLILIGLFLMQAYSLAFDPKGGASSGPGYYTYDDLVDEMESNAWGFSFFGYYAPNNAFANLPSQPPDASAGVRKLAVGAKEIEFPWGNIWTSLQRGDLIFLRTGGAAGQVVRFASSFTHVAMVENCEKQRTFEALKKRGTDKYLASENNWRNVYSYSVKRIATLASDKIESALDNAIAEYKAKPYFPPKITSAMMTPFYFLRKWSDKDDLDSMYCSKLVYRTFLPEGIDFDTERTRSLTMCNGTSGYKDGISTFWAWIGVTPDDCYYSKDLSEDLFYAGFENLSEPFPAWAF